MLALQRTHGNRHVTQLITRRSVGQTSTPVQRLLLGESYYRSNLDYKDPWNIVQTPEYKNFLRALSNYPNFLNNRPTVGNVQKALDFLNSTLVGRAGTLYDRLLGIAEDMGTNPKKGANSQALMQVANDMMADVRDEQEALGVLIQMEQPEALNMDFGQALLLIRAGTLPETILTEENLAPGENGQEPGSPKVLGGGLITPPTALTYTGSDGNNRRGVFKPHEGTTKGGTDLVDRTKVYSSLRVMAAARVDQLIGQKMRESNQEFESLIGGFDFATYKGKVGTVAEFAPGDDAFQTFLDEQGHGLYEKSLNVDLKDVELQRQLANLQLFDYITGQMDRTLGNMKVQQGRGKQTKVTGIDQDFGFYTETDIKKTIGPTAMPILVDRYFAEAILAIDPGELAVMLKGLLPSEITSAQQRLVAVQGKLLELMNANQLIIGPQDKDKYPGARTWAEVGLDEYRHSTFGSKPTDYMGSFRRRRELVIEALMKMPNLPDEPQKVQDDTGRWTLRVPAGGPEPDVIVARNDDGSDLDDLIWEAIEKKMSKNVNESNFGKRRVKIGNRGGRVKNNQ
jgi:hypothetical protein